MASVDRTVAMVIVLGNVEASCYFIHNFKLGHRKPLKKKISLFELVLFNIPTGVL